MDNKILSTLPTIPLEHQRVLLRIDGNVPLVDEAIIDDYRLQAIRPTLDFLLKHQATVLLITHIGRPTDRQASLSTQILMPWFAAHGYQAIFAHTIAQAEQLLQHHTLVVLENIRFWPGETTNDLSLAQQLKAITDVYVNDAFGTMHRADTSIQLLASLYAPNKRAIGFLVQKELHTLHQLVHNPKRPFIAIIGGSKLETKLPLIDHLLPLADVIALLPALSTTFAYANGLPIGESLHDVAYKEQARHTEQLARTLGKKLVLPTDYLVAHKKFDGPTRFCTALAVTSEDIIISIGPETLTHYQLLMQNARTIFCNGSAGDAAYPHTLTPMRALLRTLCDTQALRVVAGGDSASLIHREQLTNCIDLLSTGGGATLQYLTNQPLPGLQAIIG